MKLKKRSDEYTWYRNCIVISMVNGTQYDITWIVYAVLVVLFISFVL